MATFAPRAELIPSSPMTTKVFAMFNHTPHKAPLESSFRRHLSLWVVGLALALGLCQFGFAQSTGEVAVGKALPALNVKDQHDKPWAIAPSTRLVIFAAGRKASNLVQTVLQALPNDPLTPRAAVYLADMSKMPGFITRTFALPTLKSLPYAVGVSLDETTLANWPRQPDAVTLIELDLGVVKRISHATTETDLRAELTR